MGREEARDVFWKSLSDGLAGMGWMIPSNVELVVSSSSSSKVCIEYGFNGKCMVETNSMDRKLVRATTTTTQVRASGLFDIFER